MYTSGYVTPCGWLAAWDASSRVGGSRNDGRIGTRTSTSAFRLGPEPNAGREARVPRTTYSGCFGSSSSISRFPALKLILSSIVNRFATSAWKLCDV